MLCKSGRVAVLSVETAAGGGNRLFRQFHPFVLFETIQNNALLHIEK
jgi:hypothetical protein